MFDLVVRGDEGDVGITDGVIAALGPEVAGGREELDARGLLVLPGGVDAHVHFNEPGRTDWEGWETGSAALAVGGFTTVLEMPLNAEPPTVDVAAFDAKVAAAAASSRVDFGLWGGIVPGNREQLEPLHARGAIAFKAFMSDSGIASFGRADELTLLEAMATLAPLGALVAVHAESEVIVAGLAERARTQGRTAMRDVLASRPAVAEAVAIAGAVELARATGCRLHVVHVSTGRGAALVAEARADGVDVTCEVTPHHLLLTGEDAERLGAVAKCAPPLRDPVENAALWDGLADGTVDFVASDHSPSPPEEKRGSAADAWGGIAGGQSTLELVLTADRLTPARLAQVLGTAPADRFRLPRKGRLEVGADADLALVAVGPKRTLTADELRSRHRLSPYVGRTLRAQVRRTLLRGRTIALDGEPTGPPAGRLLQARQTSL